MLASWQVRYGWLEVLVGGKRVVVLLVVGKGFVVLLVVGKGVVVLVFSRRPMASV